MPRGARPGRAERESRAASASRPDDTPGPAFAGSLVASRRHGRDDLALLRQPAPPRSSRRDGLEAKLALGRPLRVKLGLDPTAPTSRSGYAVVLRKLRQFQDARAHVAVLIIGDFTARVGDPSGKSETRPRLRKDEVDGVRRAPTSSRSARPRLDERAEVRRNAEWLETMDMEDVLRLAGLTTSRRCSSATTSPRATPSSRSR